MDGGTPIVRFCWGKRTIECAFRGLRKLDWSGLCPFPPTKITGLGQTRGQRIQNRFWGGALWYVFPSPEFSTPPSPLAEDVLGKLNKKGATLSRLGGRGGGWRVGVGKGGDLVRSTLASLCAESAKDSQ